MIECPPGVTVDTYPGALGQVLTNLLINAIDARLRRRAGGPAVDPRQRAAPGYGADRLLRRRQGHPAGEHRARCSIRSSPPARSSGSTGLGLHIVYNLVTSRLQGHINLYSKLGRGTRFTIDIPKVVAEAAPDGAPERQLAARRSLRICGLRWPPVLPARLFLLAPSAEAKTLVFCSEGNPESLNPQIVTTTTGMNAGRPFFNNLVEFPPGSTELGPALAEVLGRFRTTASNTSFHLRRGVKFHSNDIFKPTREMNADDVLFSLERQWKEDHPFHNVGGSNYDYFKDMGMPDLLKSIEKVDDHTVRIRLTRPEAPFLADLAMPFNIIQSAEYADQLLKAGTPEKIDTEPIGTGPFEFVGFQPDVAVRYRAFDGLLGRQAADRHAGLLDHAERRRCASPS